MPGRSSVLFLSAVMMASAGLFGCDETVHVASADRLPQHRVGTVTPIRAAAYNAAVETAANAEEAAAAADRIPEPFDGLTTRMQRATEQATSHGAAISVAVFDRSTREMVSNGNDHPIATASVVKLFIADDLLMRTSRDALTPDERAALDGMLRSSDDGAADLFWYRNGGSAIVNRVAVRYGLKATYPPANGAWWNTITTVNDLVRYYDMLLSGSGGLPPDRSALILRDLILATPAGIDGYPQRFGIPDGLYAVPVAVKQGWMCCIGSSWMHLSSGVIGPERRYIMVIESRQSGNDAAARETITQAVRTMFPHGQI